MTPATDNRVGIESVGGVVAYWVGRSGLQKPRWGRDLRYAENGFNLEVDLTRGNIERVETDPELTELYLGGQGTSRQDTVGQGST